MTDYGEFNKLIVEHALIYYVIPFVGAMNRGGMDAEVHNSNHGTVREQIKDFLLKHLGDENKANEYMEKITKGEDVPVHSSIFKRRSENG